MRGCMHARGADEREKGRRKLYALADWLLHEWQPAVLDDEGVTYMHAGDTGRCVAVT